MNKDAYLVKEVMLDFGIFGANSAMMAALVLAGFPTTQILTSG